MTFFQVLLSPDYLPAMRRRRSSDPMGDTASNLGNAMDELMRHQPSLKEAATGAIIKLLEELCALGRDPKYICWKAQAKPEVTPPIEVRKIFSTHTNTSGFQIPDWYDRFNSCRLLTKPGYRARLTVKTQG